MEIDSEYYIKKVLIPPLERIFNLMGGDVKAWYDAMPKSVKFDHLNKTNLKNLVVHSSLCLNCGQLINVVPTKGHSLVTPPKLCDDCLADELKTFLDVQYKKKTAEKELNDVLTVCKDCTMRNIENNSLNLHTALLCTSEDCPIFYDRIKLQGRCEDVLSKYSELEW
ncbi:unnamed protein product [Ambrosiozyma monospora]|uniref:Unnamed protein product n=1 Tax=Ambrosiozyma monospora TaxID=43982 RepID=A0ACB5T6G9_AMBMO|nr:unnamed protein product [Ambrosiozyma monospora]